MGCGSSKPHDEACELAQQRSYRTEPCSVNQGAAYDVAERERIQSLEGEELSEPNFFQMWLKKRQRQVAGQEAEEAENGGASWTAEDDQAILNSSSVQRAIKLVESWLSALPPMSNHSTAVDDGSVAASKDELSVTATPGARSSDGSSIASPALSHYLMLPSPILLTPDTGSFSRFTGRSFVGADESPRVGAPDVSPFIPGADSRSSSRYTNARSYRLTADLLLQHSSQLSEAQM